MTTNLAHRAILRVVVECGKITREVRLVHWSIRETDGALYDEVRTSTVPRFPAHYTDALVRMGHIRTRRIFWEPTEEGVRVAAS